MTRGYVQNLVAYAGHKYKTLNLTGGYIPDSFENYYEPFMGMGVIGLNIIKNYKRFGLEHAYFSELNEYNVELFNLIQQDPNDLIDRLEPIVTHPLTKEYYLELRDDFNKDHDVAKYMILVNSCFGNDVRFKINGDFASSYDKNRGNTKPATLETRFRTFKKKINEISNVLNLIDVDIEVRNYYDFIPFFEETRSESGNNFIVLDPPYSGSKVDYSQNERNTLDSLNVKMFDDAEYLSKTYTDTKILSFDYVSQEDIVASPMFHRMLDNGTDWAVVSTNYDFQIQRQHLGNKQKGIEIFAYNYRKEIEERRNTLF